MKAEISEKVDALAQLQQLIPLSQTQLKEMNNFTENQTEINKVNFLKQLKKHFKRNQEWIEAYSKNSEFDLQIFFETFLADSTNQESETISMNRLAILTSYTCAQNPTTADIRKGLLILN